MKIPKVLFAITLLNGCAESKFENLESAASLVDETLVGEWEANCGTATFITGLGAKDFKTTITFDANTMISNTDYFNTNGGTCTTKLMTTKETFRYWLSDREELPTPIDPSVSNQLSFNLAFESQQYIVTAYNEIESGTSGSFIDYLNIQGYCNFRYWIDSEEKDLTEQDPCNTSSNNLIRFTKIRIDKTVVGDFELAIGTNSTIISNRPNTAGATSLTKK